MEHAVTVGLQHLGVDVEARVPQLGDLLREQLHAVHGVAEDDRLIDLELGEQSVQAMHLLALLHERIILWPNQTGFTLVVRDRASGFPSGHS